MQKHFVISVVSPSPDVFATVTTDITSQKTAERALIESEDRFGPFSNRSTMPYSCMNCRPVVFVDVNQRVCEMYGYSREEALHQGASRMSSNIPPYTETEAMIWLQKAAQEGPQTFDWQARHKDGRLFWVEVSLRFARMAGRDCIIASVRDATERRHL